MAVQKVRLETDESELERDMLNEYPGILVGAQCSKRDSADGRIFIFEGLDYPVLKGFLENRVGSYIIYGDKSNKVVEKKEDLPVALLN